MRSGYSPEMSSEKPARFSQNGQLPEIWLCNVPVWRSTVLSLSLSETVIGLASGESGDAGSDKRFEQATPTTDLGRMSGLFLARECACWP
jgi:hypothetical protein